MRVAEKRHRALVRDRVAVRAGDELVEQRQRVTRRSATGAHDQRQHALVDLHALFGGELLDVLEHRRWRHEPERIVVRARADGAEHLVGLGGREDELDVRRRLFDELQQGVEALRGHHVRLVEDEDLEAVATGGESRPLTQVARIVDAVVTGRVDLDDVERSAAGARELHAAGARATRGVRRTLGAVQAAGEDARGGRLSAAARTGEQIRVTDAVAAQSRHERIGHLRLPDHLAEVLGPVAAVQGCGHCSSLRRTADTGPPAQSSYTLITGIVVVTTGTEAEISVPSSRRASTNCPSAGRPDSTGP